MIPVERAHLLVKAISHSGLSGKNNEDRYGISAHTLEGEQKTPSLLAVIADGIGGHRAGEVAAELAIETISRVVAESDGGQPLDILEEAVVLAGQTIYQASQKDIMQLGMGSTCACAWILGDRLYTASVGDSRIYRIRGDRILQLTTDHTWVQEAIDQGALSPDQARRHPNAHVIRRYLGSRQNTVPDLRQCSDETGTCSEANQGSQLLPDDILLLCSDGLTDLVSDREILGVIQRAGKDRVLDELVRAANQRGGHDNITILLIEVPPASGKERDSQSPLFRHRIWSACFVAGAALVVITVFFVGALWYLNRSEGRRDDPRLTQPESQVTLFASTPGGEVEPSSTPLAQPSPGIPAKASEPEVQPGLQTPILTPVATLTAWPTNTPGAP